jgi:hypothetical protein
VIHFLVPRHQEFGIRDYLALDGRGLSERMSIRHYEYLAGRRSLPAGTYIFSALDQLSAGGMRMVRELEDQLRRTAPRVRIVNSPSRTLLRFPLLERLHQAGHNRHGVARATSDLSSVRFPAFLREEHHHTGPISPLIHSLGALRGELGRAIVRGFDPSDLLVVEFAETMSPDGFYRRYPAFVVGSEIIPRGLSRSRRWMVKLDGVEFTEASILEERAYVLNNPHEQALRRIVELAGIEYGRIDYALKDGAVETWEINLNPTIGMAPGVRLSNLPEALEPLRRVAMDHFYSRLQSALEALDIGGAEAEPIAISYSAGALRGLDGVVRPKTTPWLPAGLARVLRPFKPLLNRIARASGPLLLRVRRAVRRLTR